MPRVRAITNRILLQHMQGMKHAMDSRFDRLEKRMDGTDKRMDGMDNRFERLESQMSEGFRKVNDALQRLYIHRVSMLGRIEKLEEVVGIG